MSRRARLLAASGIVAAALVYLIVGGIRGAIVYYITPSELLKQGAAAHGRTVRLGGQVESGSRRWDAATQDLRFTLTDSTARVPVHYRGVPPGLFTEGQGAIVEGRLQSDGIFRASSVIVRHSEVYAPPSPRP